jgi:hypothetical protein
MEYNAVTDFSTTNNPNGVWEYLVSGALLTTHLSYFGGDGWYNGLNFPNYGGITHNTTGTTYWVGTQFFPADHVSLDPESNANVSVRFTAPDPGTFTFTGDFEAQEPTDQHAHPVEILVNGVSVFSKTISTSSQHDPFSIQATLAAGDTVDFAVEPGPNGDLYYLGTGLAVTVVQNGSHWVAGSGNFNTAADWNPQGVPGATSAAIIDAAGTYTVTASTNETVDTLTVAANAKLVVSGGTFTVSGSLAGSATLDSGAVLAVGENDGTITGAGQLGGGQSGLPMQAR